MRNTPLPGLSIKTSITGYKKSSSDVNESQLIIPSNSITMEGVEFPVAATNDRGGITVMSEGKKYKFKGDSILEKPIKI
jgi:hypothetical protein